MARRRQARQLQDIPEEHSNEMDTQQTQQQPQLDVLGDLRDAIAPTSFRGTTTENPARWLQSVNDWAELRGLPEVQRIAAARLLCRERARRWADNLVANTWTDFKEQFTSQFVNGHGPTAARHLDLCSTCQKPGQTASDYLHVMQEKAASLNKTQIETVHLAIAGLRPEYKEKVEYQDIVSLDQLERLCTRIEYKEKPNTPSEASEAVYRSQTSTNDMLLKLVNQMSERLNQTTPAGMNAVQQPYSIPAAPVAPMQPQQPLQMPPPSHQGKKRKTQCWWCDKPGHMWTECYSRGRGAPATSANAHRCRQGAVPAQRPAQVAYTSVPAAVPGVYPPTYAAPGHPVSSYGYYPLPAPAYAGQPPPPAAQQPAAPPAPLN